MLRKRLLFLSLALCGCARPDPVVLFEIRQGPGPMAYQAHLQTRDKVLVTKILIESGQSSDLPISQNPDQQHSLQLLGLYPGRTHQVRLEFCDERGETAQTDPQTVTTPPLPANFPQLKLTKNSPKASGGYFLFSAALQAGPGRIPRDSYLILCDHLARPLWYMPYRSMLGEVSQDADGLWVQSSTALSLTQSDWSGSTRQSWQAKGLRPPSPEARAVATDTFHHDFVRDGAGGFWTLSTTLGAVQKKIRIVDDLIVHIDKDGAILRSFPIKLDPQRKIYPKEFNFWSAFYGPLVEAWGHANALALDADQKTAVISLRLQDALVQFDLSNGQPQWILADPQGWNAACRKLLLQPQGKLQWPARQHAVEWTRAGNLLLFDNGRTASRAVEYAVDSQKRTVSQVWEYTETPPFYSTLLGDVDELPNGNVLIVDGWRRGEGDHVWARLLEVTRQTKSEKLWEITVDTPNGPGCSIYRCQRLNSLY